MSEELYHDVYKRFAKNFDVYDADTVKCDIDEGDYRWEYQRPLRVFGIDAPELKPYKRNYKGDEAGRIVEKQAGFKARDRARAYIDAAQGTIVVQTIKLPGEKLRDKYGRTLARIWVPLNGIMVDLAERLLTEGHARPYDGGTKFLKWVQLRPMGAVDPVPA